jgi:hypothetical protein
VLQRRDDETPLDALRDLIGLCRSLYRAKQREKAPPLELDRIARVGRALGEAYRMALSSTRGTMGYFAAWERCERACSAAGHLVGCLDMAEPIVNAARDAVYATQKRRAR